MKIYFKLLLPALLICAHAFSMEESKKRKVSDTKTEQDLQNQSLSLLKKQKLDTSHIDELGNYIAILEQKYNMIKSFNQSNFVGSYDISQSDETLEKTLTISRIIHFLAPLPKELVQYFLFSLLKVEIDDIVDATIQKIGISRDLDMLGLLRKAKKSVERKVTEKYLLFHDIAIVRNLIPDSPEIIKDKDFLNQLTLHFKATFIDKIKMLNVEKMKELFTVIYAKKDTFFFLAHPLAQLLLTKTTVHDFTNREPWIILTDNLQALHEAFNNPEVITAHCETMEYASDLDMSSRAHLLAHNLLDWAIKEKAFDIAAFLINYKFNMNNKKYIRRVFVNLIASAINLSRDNINDKELINQCYNLIKALLENGTYLSSGRDGIWGQYEAHCYSRALEKNRMLRKIENKDYANSIRKLLETASKTTQKNPPRYPIYYSV